MSFRLDTSPVAVGMCAHIAEEKLVFKMNGVFLDVGVHVAVKRIFFALTPMGRFHL